MFIGNTLYENVDPGSSVAVLLATDADPYDYHTYSLVDGFDDNHLFNITGNLLTINESPNFEIKNSYSIQLKAQDLGGNEVYKSFVLNVEDVLEIDLINTDFNHLPVAGSVVATLTEGGLERASYSYSLVSGSGDDDNYNFTIEENVKKNIIE